VLGNIFSHLAHPAQIAPMLRAYQDLRLPRTAETQLSSRLNQKARDLAPPPTLSRSRTVCRSSIFPTGLHRRHATRTCAVRCSRWTRATSSETRISGRTARRTTSSLGALVFFRCCVTLSTRAGMMRIERRNGGGGRRAAGAQARVPPLRAARHPARRHRPVDGSEAGAGIDGTLRLSEDSVTLVEGSGG